MSGCWEINAAVSPAAVLLHGVEELLVRVQITDLENPDRSMVAFIDLPSTEARRIALEISPPLMTRTGRASRTAGRRRAR